MDDDFDPSTPGWGVTHFAKIQDAIDYVDQHNITICIISVFPGTYNENVLLEDNLFTFFAMRYSVTAAERAAPAFLALGRRAS